MAGGPFEHVAQRVVPGHAQKEPVLTERGHGHRILFHLGLPGQRVDECRRQCTGHQRKCGEGREPRRSDGSPLLRRAQAPDHPGPPPRAPHGPAPWSGPAPGPRAARRAPRPGGRPERRAQGSPRWPTTGREQVQVDVEEGDAGRAAHPVQDGFGPHEDRRVGHRRSRRTRRRRPPRPPLSPSNAASSSRSRLTPARKRLHAQTATARAHDGPRLAAARTAQHLLVVRMPRLPRRSGHSEPARRSAGRRAAARRPCGCRRRRAAPGRGPPRSSRTVRASRTNSSENKPVRGSAPRRSTRSKAGQPDRSWLRASAKVRSPPRAARLTGGTGEARMHGAPSRAARSTTTSTALYVGALSSR